MTASKKTLTVATWLMLTGVLSCVFALDPFFLPPVAHPTKLIGTWSAQVGKVKHEVSFSADFTFSGKCMVDGNVTDEYSGKWSLDDRDNLSWTYVQSKVLEKNSTDKDRIMSIDANAMSLLTSDRKIRNYTKVPDHKK